MKKIKFIVITILLMADSKAQNVGIGTMQPASLLHISGSNVVDTASGQILLSRNWVDVANSNSSAVYHYFNSTANNDQLVFGVSGSGGIATTPLYYPASKMVIQADGNVGIGTNTPTARLEIAGQIKITGGTPGAGKVLTSDATGLASWATVNGSTGTTHTVGEVYGGGKIFSVTPDGLHGLIAETADQGSFVSWYTAQDQVSNPAYHTAAGKNYTDWRLPTKYELSLIYSLRGTIGGFTTLNNTYWSSSESDYTMAYLQNFNTAAQPSIAKSTATINVRAVRSF